MNFFLSLLSTLSFTNASFKTDRDVQMLKLHRSGKKIATDVREAPRNLESAEEAKESTTTFSTQEIKKLKQLAKIHFCTTILACLFTPGAGAAKVSQEAAAIFGGLGFIFSIISWITYYMMCRRVCNKKKATAEQKKRVESARKYMKCFWVPFYNLILNWRIFSE